MRIRGLTLASVSDAALTKFISFLQFIQSLIHSLIVIEFVYNVVWYPEWCPHIRDSYHGEIDS